VRGRLALVLAVCAVSTGAPFVTWAGETPGVAFAAMRVSLAAVLLLVIGRHELAALRALTRRDRWLVVLAGAFLAIHFGVWIASLSFTSTAASVALVSTNPVFAALFGRLLGDRVTQREVLGIAIAAIGCAVLAGGDWQAGGEALAGDVLALLGAATATAYLIVGRKLRASVPLLPYLGVVNAIAAVMLLAAVVATGTSLVGLRVEAYAGAAGAAVVASVVGHTLINAAVRTTPTHVVALAVLGEPIVSSLITWAAFGEQPPVHAALGGAVIIAGIAVGFVKR
jgi:drug/metabolite transporter (DMT)-like permease